MQALNQRDDVLHVEFLTLRGPIHRIPELRLVPEHCEIEVLLLRQVF